MKAWGDPSSKAEFQSSKTLWRSKQTPVLELPKPGTASCCSCQKRQHRSGENSCRVKVLECRNRDQTSQEQRELGSHPGPSESRISEESWKPAPPFPELFLSLTPGIAAPEMPPRAVFSNKVTLKQGKYKYVLGPFVSCHPKEPKDSFLTQLCKMITKNQL